MHHSLQEVCTVTEWELYSCTGGSLGKVNSESCFTPLELFWNHSLCSEFFKWPFYISSYWLIRTFLVEKKLASTAFLLLGDFLVWLLHPISVSSLWTTTTLLSGLHTAEHSMLTNDHMTISMVLGSITLASGSCCLCATLLNWHAKQQQQSWTYLRRCSTNSFLWLSCPFS